MILTSVACAKYLGSKIREKRLLCFKLDVSLSRLRQAYSIQTEALSRPNERGG